MTIFYFTATGNSLSVAKHIGENLISIPQIIDSDNLHYADDVIGIVFPVYALSTPKMVGRFLDKVKLEADYTFTIGTYGNMAGAVMDNVQSRAKKAGNRFDYADTVLMLDNYIPMFEMETEIAGLPKKKVDEQIKQVVENIRNRKHRQVTSSLVSRGFSAAFNKMLKYDKVAQNYVVDDKCVKCGICTKVCIAKNICVGDKVNFGNYCEGCQACLHLCPQNAIHLKKQKSNKRWRNPAVALEEIIMSNNRGGSHYENI